LESFSDIILLLERVAGGTEAEGEGSSHSHTDNRVHSVRPPSLLLQLIRSEVDVGLDPALFPRGRSLFREGYAVHSCIAAGVEEQAPRIGVVIFPALCDDPVVTGQLQHLCIGIFPTNAPAVMCSFKVRDGSKARPMPCGMLFFVPMALQSFKSRVDHSISPP
jgi:hypothetical protein